jgi:CheY-like chemotaxis protein/PAS domain-containing protein
MSSLQIRLLLTLTLVGGALILAKASMELGRAEAPVTAQAKERARSVLLEVGLRVERAYASGDEKAVRAEIESLSRAHAAAGAALVEATGTPIAGSLGTDPNKTAPASLAPALELLGASGTEGLRLEVQGSSLFAAMPVRLERGPPDPKLEGPPEPAPGAGFALARFDLSGVLAAARGRVLRANIGVAVGLLILLLAAALVTQLSLARPARRITHAIERFDLGERAARTGIRGGDLGRIARAFDAMAERLQTHEADLLETKHRLELVLKCVPLGVMVVRRDDGRPIYVNPRWKDLHGIPIDASRDILSLLSTVRCERPDGSPYPLEQLPIPITLRTGRIAEVRDLRVRRNDTLVSLVAGAIPVSLWRADTFDAVVAVVQEPGAHVVPLAVPEADVPPSWEMEMPVEADLDLPLAVPTVESREPLAYGAPPLEPEREGETVLVVEGEAALRSLAEETLSRAGFRVVMTDNGDDAMTLFRVEAPRPRVVVLDLWVPGAGGGNLIDELLALDPTTRVVAASGYRPDMPDLAASGKVVAFLPKPYGAERLLGTVRDVVERSWAEEAAGR